MNLIGIIAGIIAALKMPSMMWNAAKHGEEESPARTKEDIKKFIDNIDGMREDLEFICKRQPEWPPCKEYFAGAYSTAKWGTNQPKLDPMYTQKLKDKDLPKNIVKRK